MKIKSEPVENKKYAKQIEQADEFLVNNNFQGSILISQKNKIIFAKGYGISDINDNSNPQNSINTVYEIGSITKQITATAIMQLIEKNKISLDTTIDTYFPEFEDGKNITVQMLLTMRSGLYDYINAASEFFPKKVAKEIERKQYNNQPVDNEIVLKYLNQAPMLTTPDSTFFYCNTDYFLLAKILEKVSGLTYEQYIQKNILEPCGMTNTNCKFQQTTSKGYDNYNHYYSFPENYALGCGNINSTVLDLFKWNTQLPKGKIIKKKSFKKIISQNYYSYGLIKVSDSIFHAGNTNVFNSYNIYNHKTKTSIIILINRPIYNQNSAQIAEKIKTIFNFQI